MRYTVNDKFFAHIDDEATAYWLGLLFADGCVVKNGKSWRTCLTLARHDEELIGRFKDAVRYSGVVELTDKTATVRISSKSFGEFLISQGCTPRKSLMLRYPEKVPQELKWHFIRGYFDGDGSLCIRGAKGTDSRWSLSGTKELLEDVSVCLNEINVNCTVFPATHSNIFVLSVSGSRQIRRLSERMYSNATVYMQRKFETWQRLWHELQQVRPMRQSVSYDKQKIVDAYQSGLKIPEIESMCQITNATMYKVLREYKIQNRNNRMVCHR